MTIAVALPSLPPKQVTFLTSTVTAKEDDVVIVVEPIAVQPLPSITVTV